MAQQRPNGSTRNHGTTSSTPEERAASVAAARHSTEMEGRRSSDAARELQDQWVAGAFDTDELVRRTPDPMPADRPTSVPVEFCRFGWAVPGGTGHVCYRDRGHEPPHRCNGCGLAHKG